ncbi:urease accessory protein UreE [Flavivirga jejuensis]|uniref:Urease accessory protein UreE n=1 Tax=Flavivirga jejuensis TaxID=870487 RepID=A0ABT8WKE1_9FLAO|nr:urease accessory protein UreE [Flavivirga jejuensis]MDO5973626.1 urease accessory protein UreE [Flavivirga jejuensis]
MIISEKPKQINPQYSRKTIIQIDFDWFETNKRIQHKTAKDGQTFRLKFLKENPNLKEGELLYENEDKVYCIHILPCDCLVINPKSNFETASICYEIGNKHLPLFYEDDTLLVPFEKPLFNQLKAMGFDVFKAKKSLLTPLKTTVTPHGESKSLFSKIMDLTER